MVTRGEISKGYTISRRGRIARTERVGGRGAERLDRVALGDFSSRANWAERYRRGQALVEMTVTGRAGLSLAFSDLANGSLVSSCPWGRKFLKRGEILAHLG
jgi:hypothetical protein